MKMIFRVMVLTCLCLLPRISEGKVITVGVGDEDYRWIQSAIRAAVKGDEIVVSPGRYNENINFLGKDIILRSTDPANESVRRNTIIDGGSNGDVITFSGFETHECVIEGFTIKNGDRQGIIGKEYDSIFHRSEALIQYNNITGNNGGIRYCDGNIQNNTISDNNGSGVKFCDGVIQNNIISGNHGQNGGGISYCDGIIRNNFISDNIAASSGGGVYNSTADLFNNTIVNNVANDNGGGLSYCSGFIANCIIWDNSAKDAGDQMYNSSYPVFCCVQNWSDKGKNNIITNPQFADSEGRDYHLKMTSPCIDKGNLYFLIAGYLTDIDGESRFSGINVDIGADEYGSSPDADGDFLGDVNEVDSGSDPDIRDSDNDGLPDGIEILRGTDPVTAESPPGLTVPSDFPSIQEAIFKSFPHETVTVREGRYKENLYFGGKNVVLERDDSSEGSAIIDGSDVQSVITLSGDEYPRCIIRGFTIMNGLADGYGGGIRGQGACASILQNKIIGNVSEFTGGGITECHGIIRNNLISRNIALREGGGLWKCNGFIQNNTISYNSADSEGEGLANGGGVWFCRGLIMNCIIWGNTASHEGNQMYSSSMPFWCCVEDWSGGGNGNITSDPQFVDYTSGDFHLKSTSPCIDAGNTFYLFGDDITDVDAYARISGSAVDMGSYEYGSSPDSDGDLLSDDDEDGYGGNPEISDTDNDGLPDGIEVLRGTDPVSPESPPNLNVPSDYSTIQEAIFMAYPGEEITVEKGRYFENLLFTGRSIILQSSDPEDESTVKSTIIDGAEKHSVITFSGNENDTCILNGFTVTKGDAAGYGGGINGGGALAEIKNNRVINNTAGSWNGYGGGIYRCNGKIQDNIISDNYAGLDGGGLAECNGLIQGNTITLNETNETGGGLYLCHGEIQNNIISDNSTQFGGGISECNGIIRQNTISENESNIGGGLYLCRGIIQNNNISNNSAKRGAGGLYKCHGIVQKNVIMNNFSVEEGAGGLSECNGIIRNNIIARNSAKGNGGGLNECAAAIHNNTIAYNSSEGEGGGLYQCYNIVNCIIWGNSAPVRAQVYDNHDMQKPIFSCIQDWTRDGEGNISEDPQMRDPDGDEFHIMRSSPCINAGCLIEGIDEDYDGDPRPMDFPFIERGDGSDFDMGADEYLIEISARLIRYHILRIYTIHPSRFYLADVNQDRGIDVSDLLLFLEESPSH